MGQVASVHAALYSASCLSSRWSRRWSTCMTCVCVFFVLDHGEAAGGGMVTSVFVLVQSQLELLPLKVQRRLSKADEGILRQAKHNQLLQKESGEWRMENLGGRGGEWLENLLEDRSVIHLP